MDQVLDHLEADETAADDDRASGVALGDPARGCAASRECCARRRRRAGRRRAAAAGSAPRRATGRARRSARVRCRCRCARSRTRDRARRAVDRDDLGVACAPSMLKRSRNSLGRRHEQLALVGDDVADVVRQPAVGEGHVRAAVEDDDLRRLVEPAQPRRARRAAGDAADDEYALTRHEVPSRAPSSSTTWPQSRATRPSARTSCARRSRPTWP